MNLLGDELLRLLSELGLKETYILSVLQQKRHALFGEFLAGHLWPAKLHEGVLFLNVSSRQMLLTINSLRPEILEKLSAYGVKDLRMRIGPVRREKQKEKPEPRKRPLPVPSELQEVLQEVKDPELRETITRALRASLGRK